MYGGSAPVPERAIETQPCMTQPCGEFKAGKINFGNEVPVNCTLTDWSSWSVCTAQCDGGITTRTRVVKTKAQFGGRPCTDADPTFEQQICNAQSCNEVVSVPPPQDCVMSPWSNWSICSDMCGNGVQTQTRYIITPAYYGGACDMSLSNTQPCATTLGNNGCPIPVVPVDCILTLWSAWSACSVACGGGTQAITRSIVSPAAFGGAACPKDPSFYFATQPCNTQACPAPSLPAVNCVQSDFQPWSACSVLCGGGFQVQTSVVVTSAAYGGRFCSSQQTDYVHFQPCNQQVCPVGKVDCVMGPWSEYGPCGNSCGNGFQVRTRVPIVPAANGGTPCGPTTNKIPCPNVPECPFQQTPVDCQLTPWSKWSTCDATCNGGMMTQFRQVAVGSAYGGVACPSDPGAYKVSMPCNTQPCSALVRDCVLGSLGNWSRCSVNCGGGVQTAFRSVLLPQLNGGKTCGALTATQPCNTQACPPSMPIPCVYSPWSNWSMCSTSCGDGVRERTRTVVVPAQNNGTCPTTAMLEEQMCNLQPCPKDCNSTWSEWTTCTQPCDGGTQDSFLTINSPPQNGGLACPTVYSKRQACNLNPCPIPCGFTDFSDYSSCTVGCGINGTMMSNLTILTTPMYGGNMCPQPTQLFQYCYTPCPTTVPIVYHDLIYWTAYNATLAAVAAGSYNISIVSSIVFNASTRAVLASVASAQVTNGATVFGPALPRTTASSMSISLSTSSAVTSSVTAFTSAATSSAFIPGSMMSSSQGAMTAQINTAIQTAVTLAGVSANPTGAQFFGNISNSAAQGVADAVAASRNASIPAMPINLGNNVYDPVYQVVYNTVCGTIAVYPAFPYTAKAVGCNVPYVTVPPTIVPTDGPSPTIAVAPPGSPIILIVGGIVGFVVCLCIAYICWKFYCGAAKRDVPLMDLNY